MVLTNYSSTIKYNDEFQVEQEIKFDQEHSDVMILEQSILESGKSESSSYMFSLDEIDTKGLELKTKKEKVFISIRNKQKGDYIKKKNEDELSFEDKFDFYFDRPTSALRFSKIIESTTKFASDKVEKQRQTIKSCSSCSDIFNKLVQDHSTKNATNTLEGHCDVKLNIVGEKDDIALGFKWGDIDHRSLKIDFDDDEQEISIKTKYKNKFVSYLKDGTFDKYDDEVSFSIQDVKTAQSLSILVEKLVSECETDIDAKDYNWLSNIINDNQGSNRYQQKLEKEEDACSIRFERYDTKKSKTMYYTFNLYDLDARGIKLDISKDEITVEIPSIRKEKLITFKNDEKDLEYVDKLEISFNNLDNARGALPTLEKLINDCKN